MNGDRSTRQARLAMPLACLAALGLLAAASTGAQAAPLTLRCAGRGPRNRDSAGTVLCAGSTKGRTIAGVVRDDAGRPAAARLTVTYSSWTPVVNGVGYSISPRETRELTAKADGTFSFKSNPATKESIRVVVVGDPALGVTGGEFAQADVSRQVIVKLAKLGGGVVRFTVSGTRVRPIKVYVLSDSGFELPGVKPKRVDGRGQATFSLARVAGFPLTYYVDAGIYNDLFWYQGRPRFKV